MFSKQHYIVLANILKTHETKQDIENSLIEFFKGDNAKFSETKFIKACKTQLGETTQ